MTSVISRRHLMLATAIGGVTAMAVGPADALTSETIEPGSSLGLAYANRCGTDSAHQQIRASLSARLAGQSAAPGTTLSASEVCPICGCPISVTRQVD